MGRLFARLALTLSFAAIAIPAAASDAGGKRSYTNNEYFRDLKSFGQSTLSASYKAVGKRDPKWDADAIAYLDKMAEHFASGFVPDFYKPTVLFKRDDALAASTALLAKGCDDPMVLYLHGAMLHDLLREEAAEPFLRQALDGLRARKYPAFRVAVASSRVRRLTKNDDFAQATQLMLEDWSGALSGPQVAAGRRMMLAAMWPPDEQRNEQQALVDALAARADADPWLLGVMKGRLHTKLAWHMRGTGFANTVTPEGWKGFYSHLRIARDSYTTAWKADPTLPEAPAGMIIVANGGGQELGESVMDWFTRTLEAQVDYIPAYDAMIGGPLLPRWGGSYAEMMTLADACVAKPRYDSLVPWQYIRIVRQIGIDSADPVALLDKPGVVEKIIEICNGYSAALGKDRGAYYLSIHAAMQWRAGRYQEARKVLENLARDGQKPAYDAFRFFGAESGTEAIGQTYARTGPLAAQIEKSEQLERDGKLVPAIAEMTRLAAGMKPEDPTLAYLTRRIGRARALVDFEAGRWSPMQVSESLDNWDLTAIRGNWSVQPDRTIQGRGVEWSALYWSGKLSRRHPGNRFEVKGQMEFRPTVDEPMREVGGITIAMDDKRGLSVLLDRKLQMVVFLRGLDREDFEVLIRKEVGFLIRVDEQFLTLYVDGKQVGEPQRIYEADKIGIPGLALATYGSTPIAFKDLQIRKLPPK